MTVLTCFAFLALCSPACAGNDADALRTALVALRGRSSEDTETRGATAELTVTKHLLRDWVESHLKKLPRDGNEAVFADDLNAALRTASLFCLRACSDAHFAADKSLLGYIEPLKIRRDGSFLIVQTGAGIVCGYDESAYLYSWSQQGWTRVWQTEQNTYTKQEYRPQTIHEVQISPYSRTNDYVLLTLGSQSWCTSAWREVYYRAFWLRPDPLAAPLAEGIESAYLGGDPPIVGAVTQNEILVEFRIGSVDPGVHSRTAVRHFRIEGEEVRRVPPFALSPRDFVEEWLAQDWKEAASWSESEHRAFLRERHNQLRSAPAEFIDPTSHCPATPDVWQVSLAYGADEPKQIYFLVRWRPPYEFSMVDSRDNPRPSCTEEDREIDEEPHTLFPLRK